MEILISKWIIAVYVVFAVVIILLIVGRKSAHSEIMVKASKEKVWQVISNTEQYDQWNSVINSVEGNLEEGKNVKFVFYQEKDKSYPISVKVVKIETNKLLNQFGGITGILTYNHTYRLKEYGNETKVIIHEDYRGIVVPFWNPEHVQNAYDRLNRDIKNKVEGGLE